MNVDEIRKKVLEGCKIYIDAPKDRPGGQIAGIPHYPTVIESQDLGVKISVQISNSNYKNKEKAILIMELALLDLIN